MPLTIRKDQLDQLPQPSRERRLRVTIARLREQHGERLAERSDEWLRALCIRGWELANDYGCVLASDREHYVDLMVRLGEDFDVAPNTRWAGAVLRAPLLDGSAKLDRIENHPAMRWFPGRG